jgi:hypothetical protein
VNMSTEAKDTGEDRVESEDLVCSNERQSLWVRDSAFATCCYYP